MWRPQAAAVQSGQTASPVRQEILKLSFQHLKKMNYILIKEKKAHYFDEKQLVRCQLDAEFTLLLKFAAGSAVFSFFLLLLFFFE